MSETTQLAQPLLVDLVARLLPGAEELPSPPPCSREVRAQVGRPSAIHVLSLIHISEPTRPEPI
eukprot:3938276-Pyramimonas_sp.AAC.1